MPFDFVNKELYKINYNNLFEEIMEKNILSDKILQYKYILEWINALKESDDIISKQLSTKKSVLEYMDNVQSEPEIFQFPILFRANTAFIHFRATIANQILEKFFSKFVNVPRDAFVGDNANIYWTEVEDSVELYSFNTKPIIVVPYLCGKYNYLVIDGNHRLTSLMQNNASFVRSMLLTERTVIVNELFSSNFDMLLYIFNNELCRFSNESVKINCNEYQLMNKSFLCGKGFQF